ncbi:unnamed protein product [Auanema sp. JU1783]|nr:unnamed protein product [Auanema sp. JU1783]
MDSWPQLRSSRSEHQLAQDHRIYALLEEMRPGRAIVPNSPTTILATNSASLPKYHDIYPSSNKQSAPPAYNVILRNKRTTTNNASRMSSACWDPPATSRREHSLYGSPRDKKRDSRVISRISLNFNNNNNHNDISEANGSCGSNETPSNEENHVGITRRNTPRQASFMAAMTRKPLSDASSTNEMTNRTESNRRRTFNWQSSVSSFLQNPKQNQNRRTTIYGDEVITKCSKDNEVTSPVEQTNNEESVMRRARPKSYVLATSASLPETDQSTTFSHDGTSRELSSMGSISSIENSARSAQAPHPPATHRIQKFISLFSQKAEGRGLRLKRSRTSLPEGRNPLPDIQLYALNISKQGPIRHQQLALGKNGRRNQWTDYWGILHDHFLYLCPQQPRCTLADGTNEKIYSLSPCERVDVRFSVADIAYDWLTENKNRHVIRMLTQTRSEHLFELGSEVEMLSWIAVLQSSSDGSVVPASVTQLPNSLSTTSLVSSCSSDRNALSGVSSTTNQLIMHRYKAKSSQLQSPISSKRTQEHMIQPSTSKENSSGENGEPTTPKSGRKWKKSKAGKQGSGSSNSSIQPLSNVLGVRLADCAFAPEEHVPLVVQMCVTVVEAHGMDTVGIYRIPGNTAAVNALKDTLSHGIDNMDFSDPRWRDVNVVSSLLKMFLRKLPEPLLTDKLYPFFIDANRITNRHNRLHKLRNLLRKLPRHHYFTLRYIIRHLACITQHSDVNKMETRNLALMFGPSIVRPSDDNMATMVTHMSDQCKIIETLVHYHDWMFDDSSTAEDSVPEPHPSETITSVNDHPQYGVGLPSAVSAATFNDMHNLIRKANEDQAAAMMSEGKTGKIKNMLRRNSRRDKSRGKLKIESTAPAATHPRYSSSTQQSSVDSAFVGNYQERDIDAEILSRQTVSPLASTVDQSPSMESSLGSIPDTSRTDPGLSCASDAEERRRRQQDMYSARRIFIAGPEAESVATTGDSKAIDALVNHTHHLNIANSPALDVLSEETREKIRKMQRKQNFMEKPKEGPVILDSMREPSSKVTCSSSAKDQVDALSCTSDYSTTSSAPLTTPLAVACGADAPTSSDYASSDPSPCPRNLSTSPYSRPSALAVVNNSSVSNTPTSTTSACSSNNTTTAISESRCQQKIRLRTKSSVVNREASRRHTLSDVDLLKEGRLDKLARWFGLRKSSPDVRQDPLIVPQFISPPAIVRTSPNELTPVSGDELL